MAKKKAAKTKKKLSPQPKTLLKQWHETTAGMADTAGLKINAADTSRVIDVSFDALAKLVLTGKATTTDAFKLLLDKFDEALEARIESQFPGTVPPKS
jgi:hypothetical protein